MDQSCARIMTNIKELILKHGVCPVEKTDKPITDTEELEVNPYNYENENDSLYCSQSQPVSIQLIYFLFNVFKENFTIFVFHLFSMTTWKLMIMLKKTKDSSIKKWEIWQKIWLIILKWYSY